MPIDEVIDGLSQHALRCVEGRDGDDGGCVLDFQLITSIKPEEQNVHHHKFSDAENPLAVPIIVP